MKASWISGVGVAAIGASTWVSSGCAVQCIEDASGTRCQAKSLKRFDGPAPPPQVVERAPGTPLTVDVLYGNVLVARSTSGKLEVQFMPFAYAGYDEKPIADQQLAQNLRTAVTPTPTGIVVSVAREGGSNGLGADTIVRVPDGFDGPLTIVNRGGGPVNNFDLKVEFVGNAPALSVTNQSMLGGCWIQGAPSVRSTTVRCGETISVFDVSDEVNIENTEQRHDESTPAVTLRMHGIAPTSRGGTVTSASGAISATFPAAGGFVLDAKSPVAGIVQEGALPGTCTKQESSPGAKVITCGRGPSYQLIAGARPDYIGKPEPSNVVLSFR